MSKYITLPGSHRKLLPDSRPAGSVDKTQMASLTIRVRARTDHAKLEDWIENQAGKPLNKRSYLSHQELEEKYGASAGDLDAVERLVQKHDLMVVHRNARERKIVVRGALGNLLDAFPARVRMYHHASGQYRGREGDIHIPEELEGIITGIFGFDTRHKHRSPNRRKLIAAAGPGGDNGLAATEFAKRYNFPTAFNGKALDGSGQTIAIIELGGGFRTSDLKVFFQEIGVPLPQVISIAVDHAGSHPTNADSDDGEVMLDIEVAGAVAPKAKIAVYFAPNTDQGFLDAIGAAIHDTQRKPSVISISWGGPEDSNSQQGLDAYHQLFVTAAALGITICVASGDHGTADLDAENWDHKIHVDHPSVDNLVLSCGGTQIDNGKDVVWNDNLPFAPDKNDGWASGGGISQFFAVPSYQAGAKIPKSIVNNKAGRGVPDIAMSATNYFTRVDTVESASGGTSAVAPLMAALIALLNQAKQKNVGFINPFLYANVKKGVTRDVTSGNNAINGTVKGYKAGKGWDACTGLGTPDGTAILNNL